MNFEPTLGARAWREAAVGSVVLMCAAVALGAIALSWGTPLSGMASACINAGPPAGLLAEGAGVGAEHSWLPLGVACRWSVGDTAIVQEPGWGSTIVVGSAVLAAAVAVFYLRSSLRR